MKACSSNDRLVMNAVILLTLIDEMEWLVAFLNVFFNDTFGKHAVAHDRLVMDAVILVTIVDEK